MSTEREATPRPSQGWCHQHEGIHERRTDCAEWRYPVELIGCDAHGQRPHQQNENCVKPSHDKADPFFGF